MELPKACSTNLRRFFSLEAMAASQNNGNSSVPLSYGLLLFPQFEVLDAAGPIEALNALSYYFDHQEIKLSVIAQTMEPVSPGPVPPNKTSQHFTGQQLYQPTHTFETAPVLDVLIVPGGRGTARSDEENKAATQLHPKNASWIRRKATSAVHLQHLHRLRPPCTNGYTGRSESDNEQEGLA